MKNYFLIVLIGVISVTAFLWSQQSTPQNETVTPTPTSSLNITGQVQGQQTYTDDELAMHNDAESCWLLIDGNVYDVTGFIAEHPGGDRILEGCGRDATELFTTKGGEGAHNNFAQSLLSSFQIGTISN